MIDAITHRVERVQTLLTRATLAPLLVRFGIFLSTLVGFAVAYPVEIFVGRGLGVLVIVAALPALAPRGAAPAVTAVLTVGGWLLSTAGPYGEPIALWRLLAVTAFLYLTHSLAALAAVLPYNAVVAPEVLARWVLRAFGVVLASAVLAVLLLAGVGRVGERPFLAAALLGLAVAVGAAALLAWLFRRR